MASSLCEGLQKCRVPWGESGKVPGVSGESLMGWRAPGGIEGPWGCGGPLDAQSAPGESSTLAGTTPALTLQFDERSPALHGTVPPQQSSSAVSPGALAVLQWKTCF